MRAESASSYDTWLFQGGYPRVVAQGLDPVRAYADYFQTYIQRDLRELIQIKELRLFEKFVRLAATGSMRWKSRPEKPWPAIS